MGKGPWQSSWFRHLAVAIGYAAAYEAVHPFSNVQFAIAAAVRLVFLMCLPYRYWAALLVGDFVTNFLVVYPCLDDQGAAWVAWRSIPPMAASLPVAWFCRKGLGLFPNEHFVDIKALLTCVLASALGNTAYSLIAVSLAHDHPEILTPALGLSFFIGFYFAMLAVVPWVLIARFEYRPGQLRDKVRQALESRLMLEGMTVMLPMTVLLALISHLSDMANPQLVLMMLFLPVAWLTMRHGWRATAFGSTIAILSAAFVLPSEAWGANVDVVQTELFLAITLTSLFALGARISVQAMEGRDYLHESQSAKYQARQSYMQGEQRMRQTAQALEYLAGTLHVTNGRLLQNIRRVHPHIENETFYKQAVTAHNQVYQLAENLHPLAWRERGLPAALQETIGRALDEAGIAYHCTINGRGFSRMQTAALSAVYRAACEAVVHVASRGTCSSVKLVVRGGETNGSRWIYVCAEGFSDDTSVVRSIHALSDRRRIASKLGAMGMDLGELRDRVRLFDGELRERSGHESLRVAMLFHDPAEARQRRMDASAKVRLWVR
jgi:hypothetical protein